MQSEKDEANADRKPQPADRKIEDRKIEAG
jgi:hypothetical protein